MDDNITLCSFVKNIGGISGNNYNTNRISAIVSMFNSLKDLDNPIFPIPKVSSDKQNINLLSFCFNKEDIIDTTKFSENIKKYSENPSIKINSKTIVIKI